MVGGVGVVLWKGFGHAQRHAVSKDGEQDEDVKGSGGEVKVKETHVVRNRILHRERDTT